MKTALVTGAFGQDGYFLTKKLVEVGGYRIICTGRSIKPNLDTVYKNKHVEIEILDIGNECGINNIVKKYKPDELYHFASFSAPILSWDNPKNVISTNGDSTILFLEAIRLFSPKTKFYNSSSAKIFGKPTISPQTEETPINPLDPYSLGKYIGHQAVKLYREKYGIFAVNGIMYNHESHLKSDNFVVFKICKNAKLIKEGKVNHFTLLNLNSTIDLGDPRDYVDAMHLIIQQAKPDDYIISMNISISIEDICKEVARQLRIPNILTYIKLDSQANFSIPIPFKGDNSKLLAIGWKSKYSITDIIKLILNG